MPPRAGYLYVSRHTNMNATALSSLPLTLSALVLTSLQTLACEQDRPGKLCAKTCGAKPEYPSQARKAEATGLVRLSYSLNQDGTVKSVSVTKGAGASAEHRMLNRKTEEFLRSCTFEPSPDHEGKTYLFEQHWLLR